MFIGMMFEIGGISLLLPALGIIMNPEFIEDNKDFLGLFYDHIKNFNHNEIVIYVICLIVFYYLIKTVYLIFLSYIQSIFTYEIKKEVSQGLFNGYIQQDYSFHLNTNSANIIRNITSEVNLFVDGIMKQILSLGIEGLIFIGVIIFLLIFQPLMTLTIFFALGLSSLIFYLYNKNKIVEWGNLRQIHEAKRLQNLQQGISGIKEVKIYNKELIFSKNFFLHNSINANADRNQFFLALLPRIWLEALAIILILAIIAFLIFSGRPPQEIIPILGVFAAAAFRVLPSVTRIMHSIQTLRFSLPVIQLLENQFDGFKKNDLDIYLQNRNFKEIPRSDFKNKIKINNLSFRYQNSQLDTLKDINFEIFKNEKVGIVGESGSGKTTFINLFMGLLLPSDGTINLDDKNIQEDIKGWQKNLGYVPQSVFISDENFYHNVAFGVAKDQIDKEKVKNCIELAQLGNLIKSFPDGYETKLGERGARLSGGQIQRIGIARAMYNDPEILVLDEASSSLDSKTEEEIIKSIYSIGKDMTVLMIAHRISTLSGCNKIYEFSKGKIIKTLSYNELINR